MALLWCQVLDSLWPREMWELAQFVSSGWTLRLKHPWDEESLSGMMEWDVLELLGESRGKTSGYVSAVQLNHKETESGISGVKDKMKHQLFWIHLEKLFFVEDLPQQGWSLFWGRIRRNFELLKTSLNQVFQLSAELKWRLKGSKFYLTRQRLLQSIQMESIYSVLTLAMHGLVGASETNPNYISEAFHIPAWNF